MSEFILDDLSNKVFALMPTLPDCKYSIARIDYLKEANVVLGSVDNSNYFEEYKKGLHAIKCGDAYIKDGRERVVVGVDGNYVELNDNASRE